MTSGSSRDYLELHDAATALNGVLAALGEVTRNMMCAATDGNDLLVDDLLTSRQHLLCEMASAGSRFSELASHVDMDAVRSATRGTLCTVRSTLEQTDQLCQELQLKQSECEELITDRIQECARGIRASRQRRVLNSAYQSGPTRSVARYLDSRL